MAGNTRILNNKIIKKLTSWFIVILDDGYMILQAEVNYLGQFSHGHLVKLIGYCLEDEHRLLVYEFMPRGSLENHLFRSMSSLFLMTLMALFVTFMDIFGLQGVCISNRYLGNSV